MRQKYALLVAVAVAITLAGCASQYAPDRVHDPYGFFYGFWHGMIFPFALMGKFISWILSLFRISFLDSVTIFGKPNTGFFYYFGFVLGFGAVGGGCSQAA